MNIISYEQITTWKQGLVYIKLLYPCSRLCSALMGYPNLYNYRGIFKQEDDDHMIELITPFNGMLTPPWYRHKFKLIELMKDRLCEKIFIKPMTILPDITLDQPSLGDIYKKLFKSEPSFEGESNDSPLKESNDSPLKESNDSPLKELNDSPLKELNDCYQLRLEIYPLDEIVMETTAVIKQELPLFRECFEQFLRLLEHDYQLRVDLAYQILSPRENDKTDKLLTLLIQQDELLSSVPLPYEITSKLMDLKQQLAVFIPLKEQSYSSDKIIREQLYNLVKTLISTPDDPTLINQLILLTNRFCKSLNLPEIELRN